MSVSSSPPQAPRGTRDFYPDEYRRREWLFDHFRAAAHAFAFEEVDAPVLEHADLYTRKAGEEIVGQLYHFELHGRHLALRPEMTPQIARMVMARAGGLPLPLRWFTVTQNWRYERMTRGRTREHYQWNMDIWGEAGVSAEGELIAAIFDLLGRLQVPSGAVEVRVNSRKLLEESLRGGVLKKKPEVFEPLCIIIDKIGKIGNDVVVDQLTDTTGPVGLSTSEARDVVAMLEVRGLDDAERLGGSTEALEELKQLFEWLDAYGVADGVHFDASIVRGLAYYTGIVFEGLDARGELRSVCGGGRYDRLSETLGGKPIPATGFGFGDAVIMELLSDYDLLPTLPRRVDAVVYAQEEAQRPEAIALATRLRARGERVELLLGTPSPKRARKDADRAGARRIFMLGPKEVSRGIALVSDLASDEQTEEPLAG